VVSRSAQLRSLSLAAILAAGCCTSDPADLRDQSPEVRREALGCLAADAVIDDALRSAVEEAASRLVWKREEPNPGVRAAAVRALAHLRVEEAAPALAAVLIGAEGDDEAGLPPDPSYLVRVQVVAALGRLGGSDPVAALQRALADDPHPDVRLAAARELGLRSEASPATTALLIEKLRDEEPAVRQNARRALRGLHGIDLGLEPRPWRDWWEEEQERAAEAAAPPVVDPYDEVWDEEPTPRDDEDEGEGEGEGAPDDDGDR